MLWNNFTANVVKKRHCKAFGRTCLSQRYRQSGSRGGQRDDDDTIFPKDLSIRWSSLLGMEENLFPSAKSAEGGEDGSSLEEERRLAYVGMTRAREKTIFNLRSLPSCLGQEQYNAPSRFLAEIPDQFVSKESAVGNLRFVQKYASSAASSYASYKENSSFDDQYQSFPDDHDHSAGSAYRKGMKVRHPIFWSGSGFQLEGDGSRKKKISILFSDQTIKKFVAKHARLEEKYNLTIIRRFIMTALQLIKNIPTSTLVFFRCKHPQKHVAAASVRRHCSKL